jgi:hypothetical protein
MKKNIILCLLMLTLIPSLHAASLESKQYLLDLNGTEFNLAFEKDVVVMTDGADFKASFNYYYAEPLGNIEGILPFYTWAEYLVFVTSAVAAIDNTPKPPPPPPPADDPIDLSKVTWLHTNVSKWAVTADLKSVKIGSTTITLDYDKACVWPGQTVNDGPEVNANPWIFINLSGTWYGATWEWLKTCQTVKNLYAVDGSHIKMPPLDTWHPVSGEVYYFMVSGLARQTQRNVEERSNLVKVVWP